MDFHFFETILYFCVAVYVNGRKRIAHLNTFTENKDKLRTKTITYLLSIKMYKIFRICILHHQPAVFGIKNVVDGDGEMITIFMQNKKSDCFVVGKWKFVYLHVIKKLVKQFIFFRLFSLASTLGWICYGVVISGPFLFVCFFQSQNIIYFNVTDDFSRLF